jgi:hypothetical protein
MDDSAHVLLETQPAAAAPRVSWQSWPLRDAGRWSWAVLCGFVLAGLAAGWVTERIVWGILAPLMLAASAWRFFVPIVYRLDRLGAHQLVLGRQSTWPWHEVSACVLRRRGAVLFDVKNPAAIDALRGLYLPWRSHRDEVVDCLRHYVQADRLSDVDSAGFHRPTMP